MRSQDSLTSDAGPLSAPGQEKVTNSWQRLWTTKQHTGGERARMRTLYQVTLKHIQTFFDIKISKQVTFSLQKESISTVLRF